MFSGVAPGPSAGESALWCQVWSSSCRAAGAVVIGALEAYGLNDASPAYLLAVVAVAVLRGTGPAVATAVGAFLVYDFFYIEPLYTFTVRDPAEWLNLLLLLVVGVVVGRLAGRERDRAVAAIEGEREASAMFNVSFTLASQRDTTSALGPIAGLVRDEVRASRVWIVVGDSVVADTADRTGIPTSPVVYTVLRRRPGDEPAEWVRVHAPARAPKSARDPAEQSFQVLVTAGGRTYGAIWAVRPRGLGSPDVGETRVLAAAADQVGGSLERDRPAARCDLGRDRATKRGPEVGPPRLGLARPADPPGLDPGGCGLVDGPRRRMACRSAQGVAGSIDLEAEWLNRLVTNLLDMSRVEAGELRPSLAILTLSDVVAEAVRRSATSLAGHPVEVRIPPDLPPVLVDEVFLGQVLANTLDNAAKYGGPGVPIRVSAHAVDDRVRVVIEDGGPGVPTETLPRLFEKFYRVPRKREGSRRGTGIGLAVVQGLVEAMGGRVAARNSELGGLAIELDVPIAAPGPDTVDQASDAALL